MADGAQLGLAPVLLDLRVERLELLDRLARFVQQAQSLPKLLFRLRSVLRVAAIHPRLQPLDLPLMKPHHDAVATDTHLDGGEKFIEAASAEQFDVLARRTGAREDVVVVGVRIRLEEDVVAGETQDLVAVATLGEVEGHGARGVLPARDSDGESESGSEGTADVHSGVEIENGTKKR